MCEMIVLWGKAGLGLDVTNAWTHWGLISSVQHMGQSHVDMSGLDVIHVKCGLRSCGHAKCDCCDAGPVGVISDHHKVLQDITVFPP